jgi:hypothetical protein
MFGWFESNHILGSESHRHTAINACFGVLFATACRNLSDKPNVKTGTQATELT